MLWVWLPLRARCTTLCDNVCQWLVAFLRVIQIFSTNRTDRRDITEILLKVALNTVSIYVFFIMSLTNIIT
jgi:hypothetical protein